MLTELKKLIPEFDVISFDIFDTLLLRTYYRPSDLWLDMEIRENAKGFAKDRCDIEKEIYARYRKNGAEPLFNDLYSGIPQWADIKEKELTYERESIIVNPEMLEVWQMAGWNGKKRIIVSDMYLPQDFLEEILKKNGITGWDKFYLSNACQANKIDGTLFKKLLNDLGCSASQVLHIGDNENADMKIPNKLGIVAYHYSKVIDQFLCECPFIQKFLAQGDDFEKRRMIGCLAAGWHVYKCEHPSWTYWNKIGFLFAGTLAYLYMRMVGEDAQLHGFTHLMMVARDCYILEKIFNILYPTIKTDYFYSSRLSALLASQYFGSLENTIVNRKKLCLDYLRKQGISITENEENHFIETGELTEETKNALDKISNTERKQTEEYLRQFHINPENTAIVDGASVHFTVQKFISDIVGKNVFTFYLQTQNQPNNGETLYQCNWNDARYLMFTEFLFAAPYMTVERVVDGKPVFKTKIHSLEKIKISVSTQIEAGALACAKILNKSHCNFSKYCWLDFNDAFMDNQSLEDNEMLSFACDSMAPDHNSDFFPVIRRFPPDREKSICGIKVLTLHKERVGEQYQNIMYLFGKYRLFDVNKLKILQRNGALRTFYRKMLGHGEFAKHK